MTRKAAVENVENELREILRFEFGTRCYNLTMDGNVYAYGQLPNATGKGWYLLGYYHKVAWDRGLKE